MKLTIFSIRDEKADAYMPPFFMATTGLALRAFQGAARDPKSNISQYPADFRLYALGTFDDNTATWDIYNVPQLLAAADTIQQLADHPVGPSLASLKEQTHG